jgi:hypothetical protein
VSNCQGHALVQSTARYWSSRNVRELWGERVSDRAAIVLLPLREQPIIIPGSTALRRHDWTGTGRSSEVDLGSKDLDD